MDIPVIIRDKQLTDEEVKVLAGKFLTDLHYDLLIRDDCDVLRPDGTTLLMYRSHAFTMEECIAAHAGLREAALPSYNRGIAAGNRPPDRDNVLANEAHTGSRYRRIKKDGTLAKTTEAPTVASGIVGAWDRNPRTPYCRLTAFTMANPEKFAAALPLIQEASRQFQQLCPERWQAQKEMVDKTSHDFVIPGTVFTTVTVNRNWQTAVHKDAGDYKPGFGVMTALRSGRFKGGYLCFPQYRIAIDIRTRGLLLADVHEWHGNIAMKGESGDWERISLVLYYRERMIDCGSHAEELERAKHRHQGETLRGK